MIVVQVVLLKVALDNRPAWRGERPFAEADDGRPFGFWRWRMQRPYVPTNPTKSLFDSNVSLCSEANAAMGEGPNCRRIDLILR